MSPMWKNIQKNLLKNITSVVIKIIIPEANPVCTNPLWNPCHIDSRMTSRHHTIKVKIRREVGIIRKLVL